MVPEIAIITTDFLINFVKEAMSEYPHKCIYHIYPYKTFSDLPDIYNNLPENIKGVMVSGSYPAQVIKRIDLENKRVVIPFNNDESGIYKLFFKLLNENRNLDLNRIYADILDIGGIEIEDYLFERYNDDIPLIYEKLAKSLSIDELYNLEEFYLKKHLDLWNNNKIDVSITRLSSIMYKLQDYGLNVYFAYPSIKYLHNIYNIIVKDIMIKNLEENQPASIIITLNLLKNINDSFDTEQALDQLLKTLKICFKAMNLEFIVSHHYLGFEIITNRKTVEFLTTNHSFCKLNNFLMHKLDFSICIGYGIGSEISQARINAVDANKEACNSKTITSTLINEKNEMIFLSKLSNKIVIQRNNSEFVKSISSKSGLSCHTIQKVISVAKSMPNFEITSDDLVYKLSITKRSANRYLSALKKSGMAEIKESKQTKTMGRPEIVYKILLT